MSRNPKLGIEKNTEKGKSDIGNDRYSKTCLKQQLSKSWFSRPIIA